MDKALECFILDEGYDESTYDDIDQVIVGNVMVV